MKNKQKSQRRKRKGLTLNIVFLFSLVVLFILASGLVPLSDRDILLNKTFFAFLSIGFSCPVVVYGYYLRKMRRKFKSSRSKSRAKSKKPDESDYNPYQSFLNYYIDKAPVWLAAFSLMVVATIIVIIYVSTSTPKATDFFYKLISSIVLALPAFTLFMQKAIVFTKPVK